jgi:membrane protease YdiL (CAAX protease family)
MPQLLRFACVILALFFTGTLFSCLAPGVPACFSFFKTNINYGKAIITLPLLGFIVPILSYKNIASFFLTRHFALSICSALILSVIAHFWFTNSDALRFPSSFLLTLISYLFFSILPEEALLRGFLQKEILPWVGKGWAAHITTCAITAALFTLFHLSWIANLPLIGLIFIAGLLYGILYEVTKIIEVPIFCRLLTNILCFFFLPWQGVL